MLFTSEANATIMPGSLEKVKSDTDKLSFTEDAISITYLLVSAELLIAAPFSSNETTSDVESGTITKAKIRLFFEIFKITAKYSLADPDILCLTNYLDEMDELVVEETDASNDSDETAEVHDNFLTDMMMMMMIMMLEITFVNLSFTE